MSELDYHLITPSGMRDAAGNENLESLHPVVLVGSDGNPYRFVRMFDADIPSAEGWLLGVQAAWGAWISHAGTIGITLSANADSGVAARIVWLDEQQLNILQELMPEYELRTLNGCRWSSQAGGLVVQDPQVFNCFVLPLAVEGQTAVVSSIPHTATIERTLTSAEVLVWLSDYALANGFAYTSPEDISNPDNRQGVQDMLDRLKLA
jgi:hypothetical protein